MLLLLLLLLSCCCRYHAAAAFISSLDVAITAYTQSVQPLMPQGR